MQLREALEQTVFGTLRRIASQHGLPHDDSTTRTELIERIGEMESAEFLDELTGLISLGYILCDKVNVRTMEDVERAVFRVNASYARDLRDALNPGRQREEKGRRRRRG